MPPTPRASAEGFFVRALVVGQGVIGFVTIGKTTKV
jgi:hypothetical protein